MLLELLNPKLQGSEIFKRKYIELFNNTEIDNDSSVTLNKLKEFLLQPDYKNLFDNTN